jgi:transposase
MDNSICHKGSKVASKLEKHHISRLPHPNYSPEINPCGFGLFGMSKRALRDHESNSRDEIEDVIMIV